MKVEYKRRVGLTLTVVALLVWIVDRFSSVVSTTLGKMICGEHYMCAVNGVVGDRSCGFNTDMYLSVILLVLMVLGLFFLFSSRRKK